MGEIKVQRNSLIVAVSSTILVLIIGSLAGYGFARFKPGGNFLPFWVLSMRMLPPIAFVIPIFLIFKPFQLINTFQGLAIAYTAFNLPYAVWMMKGFFEEIPIELEESALVDGCTRITVFLRIALPLAAAGIIATGIFCFILSWNEFMLALVLMRTKETFTIPVGEYVFYYGPTSGMKWGAASATAILALIPIFVMSVVIQKYLVRGLTFGAIKG